MGDSLIFRFLEKIELFLYRRALLVVTVSNSFKENLIQRKIDSRKIQVVKNGVNLSQFCPQQKCTELVNRYNLKGKFIAGYIGTHGLAHALGTILEAAAKGAKLPDGKDIVCCKTHC